MLTPNEKAVLPVLLMQAALNTHLCTMPLSDIAEQSGIPRRKVSGCLHRLDERGLIDYYPGKNQHAPSVVSIAPAVGEAEIVPSWLLGVETGQPDGEVLDAETGQPDELLAANQHQPDESKGGNQGGKHDTPDLPEVAPELRNLENRKKTTTETEKGQVVGDDSQAEERAVSEAVEASGGRLKEKEAQRRIEKYGLRLVVEQSQILAWEIDDGETKVKTTFDRLLSHRLENPKPKPRREDPLKGFV